MQPATAAGGLHSGIFPCFATQGPQNPQLSFRKGTTYPMANKSGVSLMEMISVRQTIFFYVVLRFIGQLYILHL